MNVINIIKQQKLLYWSVARFGFMHLYFSIEDIADFAWAYLETSGADTDYRVSLVACKDYDAIDLENMLSLFAEDENLNDSVSEKILILAKLLALKNSAEDEEAKYKKMQSIIGFAVEYPQYLYECDQYHPRTKPWTEIMEDAINMLTAELRMYVRDI